jgi:hypothetical protein
VRRLVADARAVGAGRSYLVEHSAGSGKSNTIAWTAHQLSNAHDAQDRKVFDKVVVITDRVVLAPGGSVAGDPAKIEGGTAAKCNVPVAEAISDEAVLPERVQEALGQLVGAAKEGLLALSVEVGLGVLRELLEQEVDEIVRAKGKWNRERTAVRHGHEAGEVTLGGRRVGVDRPRVRTADGESEVALGTYDHFAKRDQLADVVLERMLAGVSTRKYRRAQKPVGEQVEADARSTSKSAVSRAFVQRTRGLL